MKKIIKFESIGYIFVTIMLIIFLGISTRAQASGLIYKSVDLMKYTKDTLNNKPSDAQIDAIVTTLADKVKPTHLAISVPLDDNSDFSQRWVDAIHRHGMNVIFRGTWSGIEGIYSFPLQVGYNRLPPGNLWSAPGDGSSTWLGKSYKYILDHPNLFQNGDVWAILPERTEGIFQDQTSFLSVYSPGVQTNYANFFNDLKKVSDQAFDVINKNVVTGLTSNNYTEAASTWLPASVFDTAGMTVVDHYGLNHTPTEMDSDLRKIYAMHHKQIFLQEWADYWNANLSQTDRTNYLNSMYGVLQKLIDDNILIGFNYWGAWDNNREGILNDLGNNQYSINYRGQVLANFYQNNSTGTAVSSLAAEVAALPNSNPTTTYQAQFWNVPGTSGHPNIPTSTPDLIRNDNEINFKWVTQSPDSNIDDDHFVARWTKTVALQTGNYEFTTSADDGVRVYLDNQLIINQWTDHAPTTFTTSKSVSQGNHNLTIEYYENAGNAEIHFYYGLMSSASNYVAQFWNVSGAAGPDFPSSSPSLTRNDSAIDFNWKNFSPDGGISQDHFMVQWAKTAEFQSGNYRFSVSSDDGARVYLDNQLIIDQWSDHSASTYVLVKYIPGGNHDLKIQYYENTGSAEMHFNFNPT